MLLIEKEPSELETRATALASILTNPQAADWSDIYELDDRELRELIVNQTTQHVALVIDPTLGVAFMPLLAARSMLRNSESSRVNLWGGPDQWFSVDEAVFADCEERKTGDEHRNQPAKAVLYPPPSKKERRKGARDTMDSRPDIYGPVVFFKDTS